MTDPSNENAKATSGSSGDESETEPTPETANRANAAYRKAEAQIQPGAEPPPTGATAAKAGCDEHGAFDFEALAGGELEDDDAPLDLGDNEETAALKEQIADLQDRLLRSAAETENVRRRSDREKDDAKKYAVSKFAEDMVSVADNLSRALQALPADKRVALDPAMQNLMAGIEATERELQQALTRHGVTRIETAEEPFDPNRHEVMFEIEDASKPRGTILQVLQDGYLINGRLLRPARVGVAKGGPDGPVNQTA